MLLRAFGIIAILALSFACGCSHCPDSFGEAPPRFKVCNGPRLLDEFAWFYADIQEMFFGIDYYQDLNDAYGDGPYF